MPGFVLGLVWFGFGFFHGREAGAIGREGTTMLSMRYSSINRGHEACLTFLHNSQRMYRYMTQSHKAEKNLLINCLYYSRELQYRKAMDFQHRFHGFLIDHIFLTQSRKKRRKRRWDDMQGNKS